MKKVLAIVLIVTLNFVNLSSFCTKALEPNSISATSAVVICADNGRVLFEKNAYEKRPMASHPA